jgi:hypothetical protein
MSIFTKYNGDIFSHNSRVVLDGGIVESLDYLNEVSEETKRITFNFTDYYGDVSLAYSLRKIVADYKGAAIRVRRSSDNIESDIGFFNNEFDTTTLLNFVGSGDGFVTAWYDQSGNAKHLTETVATNQPSIVTGGVLQTVNNKPAINFDGVDDILRNTGSNPIPLSNPSTNQTICLVVSTKSTVPVNNMLFKIVQSTTSKLHIATVAANVLSNTSITGSVTGVSGPINNNTNYIMSFINSPRDIRFNGAAINDGTLASNNISTNNASISLGGGYGKTANHFFAMYAQEIIYYRYNNNTVRLLLENHLNSYYKFY